MVHTSNVLKIEKKCYIFCMEYKNSNCVYLFVLFQWLSKHVKILFGCSVYWISICIVKNLEIKSFH